MIESNRTFPEVGFVRFDSIMIDGLEYNYKVDHQVTIFGLPKGRYNETHFRYFQDKINEFINNLNR